MSEEFDIYLGKDVNDIKPETLKLLLEDGYSISPKSGRIRKRQRVKEVRPIISKRRARRYSHMILWAVVAIIFIICLVMITPYIDVQKKPNNKPTTTK